MPINKEDLSNKLMDDLLEMNLLESKNDFIAKDVIDIENAHVIYDFDRTSSKTIIMKYLKENNIFSIGRYGNWDYSGMEEAMAQGRKALISSFPHILS